jgi:hypothetical protein
MTQTHISDLSSSIDMSHVINLNSNYPIESIVHQLNYAFVLNREVELPPRVGCVIDTTISPNLGVISEKVPHSKKDVESNCTQNVEPKT